ncbi:RING finger protein 44 [Nephila pilipes]|uniref:RING finger protein 44 n=1 Tax=Nephila pilipes TaxID=299642 RepID=A0A8X6P379_NEPPI|nr:RING finger protein 44 [Nephila pilipes]
MPYTPKKTSVVRKLRKRNRPPHHKYNLRSKSRSRPDNCKICGSSGSIAKHGHCKKERKKPTLRKTPIQRRRKSQCHTPCVICLDTEKAKRTRKVKCGHEFHIKCINSWLKCSDSCPICRFQLRRPCLNLVRRLTLRISPYLQFHIY